LDSRVSPTEAEKAAGCAYRSRLADLWVVLAMGYAIFLHQGLGVPPGGGMATRWWHASGFLRGWPWTAGLVDSPLLGVVVLSLPAVVLGLFVAFSSRSAVALALAGSSAVAAAIMAFYGLVALRVWDFFHWRGSAVIGLTSVLIGCTLAAPALARSWLRLPGAWMLATYAPVWIAVVSLIRHATGTDPRLAFNLSPWPAAPVFGLEIGAYGLTGGMLALAAGLRLFVSLAGRPFLRASALALCTLLPALWFELRFAGSGPRVLLGISLASGLALGVALITRADDRARVYARRSLHLALGACLVAGPLLAGRSLADADYAVSKYVRARSLIDALARYRRDRSEYPESLGELQSAGYLALIPRPRIGFELYSGLGLGEPWEFDYRNLGSSYVLEFVSTEWVMCSYNPPWPEDEEIEEGEPEDPASEAAEAGTEPVDEPNTSEAWSCPDTRPELW